MWYYGYGDNMEHSSISRLNEVIKILKNSNIIKDQSPTNLCNIIEKLGPTYIKLGQILSTREDIIPTEYCKALEKLRCNVEKIDYETLLEILNKNYHNKEEMFENIDYTPIGSASATGYVFDLKLHTNLLFLYPSNTPYCEALSDTEYLE